MSADNPHPQTIRRARRLRREATRAERLFWQRFRDIPIPDLKLRRQHPIGPWIADFAVPAVRLVIEIDGGGHNYAKDVGRTADLRRRGWRVLRFSDEDVLTQWDGVSETVLRAVQGGKTSSPQPSPPEEERG